VTGGFPELRVVHVGSAHFLETPCMVFLTDEALQGVVDPHSMRKEKTTSRGEFMEEE
jgi:hypothetical protein